MSRAVKIVLGVVAVLMALGAAAASVYTAVRFLRPKPEPMPTCYAVAPNWQPAPKESLRDELLTSLARTGKLPAKIVVKVASSARR